MKTFMIKLLVAYFIILLLYAWAYIAYKHLHIIYYFLFPFIGSLVAEIAYCIHANMRFVIIPALLAIFSSYLFLLLFWYLIENHIDEKMLPIIEATIVPMVMLTIYGKTRKFISEIREGG